MENNKEREESVEDRIKREREREKACSFRPLCIGERSWSQVFEKFPQWLSVWTRRSKVKLMRRALIPVM